MQPVFTTNDSEFTRLEGLYIKERTPPATVKGVSLNVVGIAGETLRGPTGKVVEITSEARFREVFGGRDRGSGGAVANKTWQALLNKPFGALRVSRVAAADAVKASFTLESAAGGAGTAIARLDASSVGAWGNDVYFQVTAATNGVANSFDLVIKYLGNTVRYKNLNLQAGSDNTATVIVEDDGNLVTLTKLADGRPVTNAAGVDGADADGYTALGQVVAAFTAVAGSDGTVVAADYTGTGKALELVNGYKGIGVCFVAEPTSALYPAIKAKIATLAALVSDRMWLMGADAESTALATVKTDAASFRSDRIFYLHNHAYTLDPEASAEVLTRPESWAASVLSQTDVDIHPGEEDCKVYTAGIRRLYNESLTREDYIGLKDAGVSSFERDEGVALVSAVTTSITPGKEQVTRRRMADYIQLGLAGFLKYSVKKKNLASRRMANKAAVSAWLRDLASSERVVDSSATGVPQFEVDTEKLNTDAQRAAGVEKLLVRVKLIGHMLYLVLETEIGTGVTIEVS